MGVHDGPEYALVASGRLNDWPEIRPVIFKALSDGQFGRRTKAST